jgi:CO/xanthine dehydrogenase FAD-binding subunit
MGGEVSSLKPAPFDYVRAESLDHVLSELANTADAMVLAGGQTLVPMMAMRLARPARLIDLNELPELAGIETKGDTLVVRAMTRQAKALTDARSLPLLRKALQFVGHTQTRNRGTVGGSIAHADPSAEIPLVAVALGATIVLQSKGKRREIAAEDFFQGALTTDRAADECLTEIHFPVWRGGTSFQEVAPRHGDFALVSAAAQIELDDQGICRRATVAIGGASPAPMKVPVDLVGRKIDAEAARAAAAEADTVIDPSDDLHATAAYRRRVARVLVERAILEAAA